MESWQRGLKGYLEESETLFNQESLAICVKAKSPGYHTKIADGTTVRETRRNLEYALACLDSGDEKLRARALKMIPALLDLQDCDPLSKTYGIWSWFIEEPLDRMSPPDWNWADFMGSLICLILTRHAGRVPASLKERLEAALGHAAKSIFRRNVDPNYTNIAIMGACVAAFAGERLNEPWLLAYARRRIEEMIRLAEFHGAFTEFNSPTYTVVAVDECERLMACVSDPQARALAEKLREIAWTTIAGHFHQPSGQWGGPHARAYSDFLTPSTAKWLSARTGAKIEADGSSLPVMEPVKPLPCPERFLDAFRQAPSKPIMDKTRFTKRETPEESSWAAFWLNSKACLGSMNRASFWTQCHPLIGYWRGVDGKPAALRLRMLKDGRDFCAGSLRSAQSGPDILGACGLSAGTGDFHPHLDKPEDGIFKCSDLKLRLELSANGAEASRAEDGVCLLSSPGMKAAFKPAAALFNGKPISWTSGKESGKAFVDGLFELPADGAFSVEELAKTFIAFALSLRSGGESFDAMDISADSEAGKVSWTSKKLSVAL